MSKAKIIYVIYIILDIIKILKDLLSYEYPIK